MENVRDPLHGPTHHRPIGNASLHDLQPRLWFQKPVMAQRADFDILMIDRLQNAIDEMAPYLAGRSGNQDVLGRIWSRHFAPPTQVICPRATAYQFCRGGAW